jgi:hypothetical protein
LAVKESGTGLDTIVVALLVAAEDKCFRLMIAALGHVVEEDCEYRYRILKEH